MPWKVTQPVSQRLMFIAAHAQHDASIAELCRQFGISRKTGYKWINRVEEEGETALLAEHSRAPHHCPHRLDPRLADRILTVRTKHASWGPRKILDRLRRDHPGLSLPAASTVGDLLARHGLTVARKRRRRATPTVGPLTQPECANDVWTGDFKGDFALANGRRCTPLTIVDRYSRFLVRCVALCGCTGTHIVQPLFEAAFREWGLPAIIRTDNGPPFASTGLGGLTRLSVWWTKLGIVHERIEPGHPEQNGSHEYMHRVLKAETTQPPAADERDQQRRCVRFSKTYNYERPHEGIGMAVPAELFGLSPRPYPCRLASFDYPLHWIVRKVKSSGRIKWGGVALHLTDALTGEYVGLEAADEDGWWDIYFGPLLVAHFDETTMRIIEPEVEE